MFEWLRRNGWVATVRLAPHPFHILIGDDDRPDEPDGGIVHLDGPDTGGRRWHDLKDRQPVEPLSYDD